VTAQGRTLALIAVGGIIGSEARYGMSILLPGSGEGFPWSTFAVNVSGCLLIGMLMAVLDRTIAPHLIRPFAGIGLLGGYTTFSTYAVDVQRLLIDGRSGIAIAYLTSTVVAALSAVWLGATLMRGSS
jgi:CrcB protein